MYFQSPQSRVVCAEAVHCNQWEQDPVGRTQHMDDDWDLEWKHLLEQLLLQEEEKRPQVVYIKYHTVESPPKGPPWLFTSRVRTTMEKTEGEGGRSV